MDEVNQQGPSVENRPQVKTANNLTFFKTLAYGFVVVSIGISIAVGGYLLGINKDKVQPVAQVSLFPTPTPDPTANWQTYTTSNFIFKYPQDWDVAELRGLAIPGLAIGPKNMIDALRKVNFQVGGGSTPISINGPAATNTFIYNSDSTKSVTSNPLLIAGINSTEYTSTYGVDLPGVKVGDIFISSVVENKREEYSIALTDINYKDIYNQILSTFKFTGQNQAPSIVYKTEFDGGALLGTLNKSIDGGKTWKEIMRQYKGNIIYSTDSKNSNIIYAGDTGGNMMAQDMNIDLLKSTDAGEHWISISKGITDQTGPLYGIVSIVVDSSNPSIVNVIVDNGSSKINFKSSDGGKTWVKGA